MRLETYILAVVAVFFSLHLIGIPAGMLWISRGVSRRYTAKYSFSERMRFLLMKEERLASFVDDSDLPELTTLRRRYRFLTRSAWGSVVVLIVLLAPAVIAPWEK